MQVHTNIPQKKAASQITRAYRRNLSKRTDKPLPLRDFAEGLTAILEPHGGGISHQTVRNWEQRVCLPGNQNMILLSMHGWDWQADFANDILAVLKPQTYSPATEVGKRALLAYELPELTR